MKESDIRPKELFQAYLNLAAQDAATLFNSGDFDEVNCPACNGPKHSSSFEKHGFVYRECQNCRTLYLSPRPSLEAYEDFYKKSESSRYWSDVFFPAVMERRRELIFMPRAKKIQAWIEKESIQASTVVEVGAGFGLFLSELEKLASYHMIAIEPSPQMAQRCREQGFEVIEDIVENVGENIVNGDLVICFEVFEHTRHPRQFLDSMYRLVRKGGRIIFTTLGVDGFDIQTLGHLSKGVFPPHHVNFFSRSGFKLLCEDVGFEDVTIETPGELDVDIVRQAVEEYPELLEKNPFLSRLIQDDEVAKSFQKFLVENRLSSHTWVSAKKPCS